MTTGEDTRPPFHPVLTLYSSMPTCICSQTKILIDNAELIIVSLNLDKLAKGINQYAALILIVSQIVLSFAILSTDY